MPTLATTVDGLKLPNPFVIGSGPPGTNLNVIYKAFQEGWGAVIAKTVSLDASKVVNVTPRYAKLLATGLTSLILCQGILNIFVVLGLAPLTGVPLPFISYAPTNLCVMLASVGVLLNISRPAVRRLKVVEAPPGESAADRDRRRRDRGARRTGAGGSRRSAG